MKYRTLGSTGMKISVIGIGTWQLGGEWGKDYTQDEADAILSSAKDCGINFIDTAECYGDHTSESLIGNHIKDSREDWILATKFGHKFHSFLDRTEEWEANQVQEQLEESLKALRTDRIDLYQFHSGKDEVFQNDELWSMLSKQKEAGKILHLGISISGNYKTLLQIEEAKDVGAEAIQVIYNRLDKIPEKKIFPLCIKNNLGVLARVPLASGFLSGKYKTGDSFTNPNDVRSRREQKEIDSQLQEVAKIQKEELPEDIPIAQWALGWCLQHEAVTCVIPGCKNADQVKNNAGAANLDI
ncbi:aldo/keto reductase [Spirochaetota bacterium]